MFGQGFAPEEDPAGAGPGVPPMVPPAPVVGMPEMPGMAPGAVPPPGPPLDPAAGMPAPPPPGPDDPIPPTTLGAPPGPAAPPPPPATLPNGQIDTRTEEAKTLAGGDQLAQQAVDAEQAKGEANKGVAAAESQGADEALKVQQQYQQDTQNAIQQANQQTQQWLDRASQDAQKYQSAGLHDYWADKSTGHKVLAGIAIMFGAAGRANGNPGLDMVNGAIDRDFRMQQANIEKLKGNLDVDNAMIKSGMTVKQELLADNQLKKAAALDAAAAQLQSYKLKQGVPLEQAQTDANVVALRQKANTTRMETLHAIHTQNVEDARIGIEQERADAYRSKMTKVKGAGGGGGAGDAAALRWTQWAEQNPNASEADKKAKAVELHIPLNAKAGHTSYETLTKDLTNVAKTAAGAAKAQDAKDARLVHADDGDYLASNARSVEKWADQMSALKMYQKKGEELAAHIERFGRIVNPYSEAGKQRLELTRDFQAQGRQVSKISPSNAGQKLEHEMIGGAGVGVERMASPTVIRHLSGMAYQQVQEKMKIGLTKVSPGGGPQSDRDLARAIKEKQSGGGSPGGAQQYPVGTKAKTKDGKPVVMTANGWAPA